TALYKWSRRYPQIAGLAVALFLVGLIGTAGVFWQWRKASSALVAVSQAEQEKAALLEETQSQLYVHRIGLAHRELLDGRSSRASQLLDECQPARREWDWHYLQRLAHQESRTWSDFTLYPHDLALSPDGQRMLVVECLFNHPERKGGWQLIDLKSGEVVMRHEHQHGGLIGCAFAPDGKTFATCGQSPDQKRTLCVWDATTGEEKWHTGRTKSEAHVTYSPDGSTLATAGHDGKIRLWDTQGNLLHSLRQGKQNNFQVDFHPTQPWLASVSRAGKLCVWHAESGELLHSKQVYGDFRSVKFSPSGRWLAVVGYQSYLAVMDVNDGYRTVLKGGEPIAEVAGLFAVGFSPDQKRLLACGTSGEAFLWDMEKLKFESSLNAHSEAIFDCQWLDEHRFVTCSDVSKSVKEWDLRQLDRPRAVPVHNVCTSDMAVGASGKLGVLTTNYNHFYGGEEDFDLKLVDLDSLQTIKSLKGHETWHTAVAVSRDERNAVSGDKNGRVFYWDLESGKREKELLRKEDDSPAIEIGFAEKDDSIFAVTANGNRFQWDRATGELMGQATLAEKIDIAVFDEPTTECLLANGSQLELWNIDPPKRLSTWAIESPDFENDNKKANDSASESHLPIVELALSQSKNLVAVALEKAVYVWRRDIEGRIDLKSVTVIREPADRITSIAFNPNGRRLAIGNENTTVRIWDPTFGAETLTLRAANQSRGVISECRFSLDGSQLFACHTFITAWSGDDIGEAPRSPSQDD
ncbi:MAG: WD40 repeat domain-containing protein, partial [Planctomycetota bacterium]